MVAPAIFGAQDQGGQDTNGCQVARQIIIENHGRSQQRFLLATLQERTTRCAISIPVETAAILPGALPTEGAQGGVSEAWPNGRHLFSGETEFVDFQLRKFSTSTSAPLSTSRAVVS